jgi:ribosome biogenesis protein UTP30
MVLQWPLQYNLYLGVLVTLTSSIRLGTLSHLDTSELSGNLEAILPIIVAKHVKGGWENVQSIDLKTGNSAALPVWNSKLEDRWIGMPEQAEVAESEGESEEDETKKIEKIEKSIRKAKATEEPEKKSRSSLSKDKVASKTKA